ncbi:unnamed protein product [Mytilus coruscus]|uniref:Uncharacterized protein n=1 Tax=Mytilus coruscus TaxID=42192 RepID=A0A6J8CUZ9_MYTCO|nr:unnamed protein product [Mytilus coruscus]
MALTYLLDLQNAISSAYTFDYFVSFTEIQTSDKSTENCRCSHYLEGGFKDGVSKQHILDILEISISYCMCPHVLQNQSFAQVTNQGEDSYIDTDNHISVQPNFFDSWTLKRFEMNFPTCNNRIRNSVKQTAGVYWTHLTVFFGKEKFIVSMLKYCKKKMYDVPLFTLLHNLSVCLLSVLHENSSILYEVVSNYPRSILSAPINFTVHKNGRVLNCDHGAFSLVLELKMFHDFKMLYKIVRKDRYLSKEAKVSGMDFCNLLSDTMNNLIIHKNEDDLEYLLSVKKLPLESYASLFYLIYKSGNLRFVYMK